MKNLFIYKTWICHILKLSRDIFKALTFIILLFSLNIQAQINDNVCDAIALTIDTASSGGAYSNLSATIEANELGGPCYFDGDVAENSVWFSFEAPASGSVQINTRYPDGTLTDSQLLLYDITDCNDLTTATLLACDEDDDADIDIGGSPQFNALIEYSGLSAGQTYYVSVDGWASNVGTFDIGVYSSTNTAFITTWNISTDGESITIPIFNGETYNYTVNWGDGSISASQTGGATHIYDNSGTYHVSITGVFPRIHFYNTSQDQREKIIDISQWGDNTWTSMKEAFYLCLNLEISATDAPNLSNVTDLSSMLYGATTFNQPIGHWDVSNVTNLRRMLSGANAFNQPLNDWDVSSVTTLQNMFNNAYAFNQPLNNWDVSNVTNLVEMFESAISFNQLIDNWDVSNVTKIRYMFSRASSFNQPLNNWDVGNVTEMIGLFREASSFNQSLCNWDVSNIQDFSHIFNGAWAYNQSLDNWDISNASNLNRMFQGASSFNQPLNNWDTSNVSAMAYLFYNASSFNKPLNNWDVGNVNNMTNLLNGSNLSVENYDATLQAWSQLPGLQNDITLDANTINYCNSADARDLLINTYNWTINDAGLDCSEETTFISTWQTTSDGESITIPTVDNETYDYTVDWGDGTVINNYTGDANHTYTTAGTYDVIITGLFPRIHFLNASPDQRDKIIDIKQWGNNEWTSMQGAFYYCSNLEISAIDAPDLTNVTDLSRMFQGATSFNQSIDHWDLSSVFYMSYAFSDASTFNQPLNNWDVSNIISMQSTFNNASAFNQPLNNWDVSNVFYMDFMFSGASSFNQTLNDWNISNVPYMSGVFSGASAFNQPLSNWDVSSAINMDYFFSDATAFNQPLNNWDISSVTSMERTFKDASAFNQPLDNWDVSNVTNMLNMFLRASSFNQSLDNWDVSSVTQMNNMLTGTSLSIENYDITIQGWAALPSLQNNVTLGANNLNYCNGEAARNSLINNFGWTINDSGLDCSTLGINNESLQELKLTPNPSIDYITILNLNTDTNYVIYNVLGKKVNSGKLKPGSKIQILKLEEGIYFLKLENYKTLKFIKN